MPIEIFVALLVAAAFNAGWNAILKVSSDKIGAMASVTFVGSILSVLLLPFVDSPAPESWPLLALAIVSHTFYHFFLPAAYRHGNLGQVYPIARGTAPLLVTIGAIFIVGEVLPPIALLGVLCLTAGVMSLAFEKPAGFTRNRRAIFYSLATGVCIAANMLIDGMGARAAGSALGFAVWLTIGDGILTFLIAMLWRKSRNKDFKVWRFAVDRPIMCAVSAALQIGAFWIVVWALAYAPFALVSALRETSVLFAALISVFILKEGLGVWRFISAMLVVAGIALTRYRPSSQ
jgi:drug/metabolite transporter (DMT)-like permease